MVNARPDIDWLAYSRGLPDNASGLLVDTSGLVRGGLLANVGTTLLGFDPRTIAARRALSLQDPVRSAIDPAAMLTANISNPFGFVDRQDSDTGSVSPLDDKLLSSGVSDDRPRGAPAGMMPIALPPSNQPFRPASVFEADRVTGPGASLPLSLLGLSMPAAGRSQESASFGSAPYLPPVASDGGPRSDGLRPPMDPPADPNIVRVADRDSSLEDEDIQIAQQQGNQPQTPQRPPVRPPANQPQARPPSGSQQQTQPPAQQRTNQPQVSQPAGQAPGRGYAYVPQAQIERGMTTVQKKINRDQAFRELTRQPLSAEQLPHALPDDWESTKPADLVDEIRRAAERHGVPIQLLARLLYQEGKFNELDKLKAPLVMRSDNPNQPIGYAQMTKNTLESLKDQASRRGDTDRKEELSKYSLANREQSLDAAAEQLAYLYRLTGGSWPKAVASYNVGPGLSRWFDGADIDPKNFGGKGTSEKPLDPADKWKKEVPDYLKFILRGAPEDPASGDMYLYQSSRPKDREPTRGRIYRPAIPSDTRRNP